jgi:hypothetical protein
VRLLACALVLAMASGASAQPGGMDLHAMSGRPMPMAEAQTGTVNVRVSKQLPMNGVPDVEVTAIVTKTNGESRKMTAKTGADGRAQFDGVAAGAAFQAEATVDKERLQTTKFNIPAQGGTRILLIAGLGPAGEGGGAPDGAPEGQQEQFGLGAVTGKILPAPGTPAGTLEITLYGADNKPLPNQAMQLGQVGNSKDPNALQVLRGKSDASGVVRFEKLPSGESVGYAAVMQVDGMRLGTEAFRLPTGSGARGEIRVLERTSDPSGLRFDNRSMVVVELGEDALQLMESMVFKNVSEKIYEPGPDGLLIPLPAGAESTREFEGSVKLDIRDEGVAMHNAIPPNRAAVFALQVRTGFILLAHGANKLAVTQKMPFGLEQPLILVPSGSNLRLVGPGVRASPDRQDKLGRPVKVYEMPDIAPGGTLAFTVVDLPALNRGGRNLAATLCILLVLGAVVLARQPPEAARNHAEAGRLSERREKLFAELVTIERTRRQEATGGKSNGALEERRRDLVAKLENVYRDQARREQGDAATT